MLSDLSQEACDGGIETPTEKWQQIFDVNVMSEVFAASTSSPTDSFQ